MQQALALGAAGFITKSGLSGELLQALRRVLDGEIYQPSNFSAFNDSEPAALAARSRQAPVFSPRQLEVLRLLLDGCTNRDIGEQLCLGEETIKTHVANIMRSFNAKTRTQAAAEAARWGYRKSSSIG
jgi:DNA-binding NarL/FixJ family response regulator